MTTMKQTKALLLADEIQLWNNPCARAAAELRRQFDEIKRLHEENQAMLEALKECTEWMEFLRLSGDAGNWNWHEGSTYTKGLATIAKTEGMNKGEQQT